MARFEIGGRERERDVWEGSWGERSGAGGGGGVLANR